MKLKLSGATLNYNSIFLSMLGIHNIIDQITLGQNPAERWVFTLPFFALSLVVYIFPIHKKILSIFFLSLAIYCHVDAVDPIGFNSAIVFIMAYVSNPKKYMVLIILISSSTVIVYKSALENISPASSFLLITLFAYFFYFFYKEIFSKIPQPSKAKLSSLTDQENDFLSKMCFGHSQENAGTLSGLKDKYASSKMMKDIREKLGIDPLESNYKVISIYKDNSNK